MSGSTVIGERFLAALRAADFAALGRCLDPAVRLQALLPRGPVEATGRDAAVARLRDWIDGDDGFTVLTADAAPIGPRLWLSYRVAIGHDTPARVMEQQAYCDLAAGGITTMRLLCSGTVPVS